LIRGLGGLAGIAISHPHFYSAMLEWSGCFGDAPVHLHSADRRWVMRPDPRIHFWDGSRFPLSDEVTLIHCGGHFEGGAVLHWSRGAEGKGALLTGDVIQVGMDCRTVSFMRSFPNLIPLSAPVVRSIVAAVESLPFDRVYGAWWKRNILGDAKEAMRASADRYVRAIGAESGR